MAKHYTIFQGIFVRKWLGPLGPKSMLSRAEAQRIRMLAAWRACPVERPPCLKSSKFCDEMRRP